MLSHHRLRVGVGHGKGKRLKLQGGFERYIWALDSDIDFTGADLISLFSLARASGSLIVGPTFEGGRINELKAIK